MQLDSFTQKKLDELNEWYNSKKQWLMWIKHVQDKYSTLRNNISQILQLHDTLEKERRYWSRFFSHLGVFASCNLPCPSLCCYFAPSSPLIQRVLVEIIYLEPLKEWCKKRGERWDEYVEEVDLDMVEKEVRNELFKYYPMEYYTLSKKGKTFIYPVRVDMQRSLPKEWINDLPLNKKGRPLWVNAQSYACKFLDEEGKCMLRYLIPPENSGYPLLNLSGLGTRVCRGFYCLTSHILRWLEFLGVVETKELSSFSMHELNEFAREGIYELHRFYIGDRELKTLEKRREAVLRQWVGVVMRGRGESSLSLTYEFREIDEIYSLTKNSALKELKESFRYLLIHQV